MQVAQILCNHLHIASAKRIEHLGTGNSGNSVLRMAEMTVTATWRDELAFC
jgi:hypothetical protein